ncbi:replication initiator protein A [Rhodobacteraceae bacterium NNCM2]|nr:replication initiator protein A [Coraliihabitans acroporae]
MLRPPLLPERHPTADFFICDVLDAIPKDDMASMEHPIFSLSTRPDRRILSYQHNGTHVEITPSMKGLATIHDKDVMIYCISQLIAKMNAGEDPSPTLHLKAYDLLVATNRETSGDGYKRLREAFERLSGTRIVTNIETGGEETTRGFGLIEAWEIQRKTKDGRMVSVSVRLSDWMYRAVMAKSVLTIHRDYFRLRKPLERRVYEIARKHCGQQTEWKISLDLLLKKCGSKSPRRVFKKMIRELVEHDHLPDYTVRLDDEMVIFQNRERIAERDSLVMPALDPDIYNDARIVAPGMDPYFLEAEWQEMWIATGAPKLHDPDKAFLAFCRRRAEKGQMH